MARRTCTQEGRCWLSPTANYSSYLQLSQWQDLAAAARPAHALSQHKHIQFVLETKGPLEYKSMLPLSVTAGKFNWWADRGKVSPFAPAGGLNAGHRQVCGSCCSDTSCFNGSEETLTKILQIKSPCTGVCCYSCAASSPGASCPVEAQICEKLCGALNHQELQTCPTNWHGDGEYLLETLD